MLIATLPKVNNDSLKYPYCLALQINFGRKGKRKEERNKQGDSRSKQMNSLQTNRQLKSKKTQEEGRNERNTENKEIINKDNDDTTKNKNMVEDIQRKAHKMKEDNRKNEMG